MKKIGREVLFIGTDAEHIRSGEGAFLAMADGSIMYAYTEYNSDWEDSADAHITAIFSRDGGETWGERRVIREKLDGDKNVMSVSLLAMKDGCAGLFYLRKDAAGNCRIWLSRSADCGRTWSEPSLCVPDEGYFVTNNDRVIRLASGRIVIPANKQVDSPSGGQWYEAWFYISDDDGATWRAAGEPVKYPFDNGVTGLQETGVLELSDGRVWAWFRTDLGHQYESFSSDGGETWTRPRPNFTFTSPASPMSAKRLPDGRIAAVWNPKPWYTGRDLGGTWGRTPLYLALGEAPEKFGNVYMDGVKSFYAIEDDESDGYCYTALLPTDGYVLAAYYHSNGTGCCLSSNRIVKIDYAEFN